MKVLVIFTYEDLPEKVAIVDMTNEEWEYFKVIHRRYVGLADDKAIMERVFNLELTFLTEDEVYDYDITDEEKEKFLGKWASNAKEYVTSDIPDVDKWLITGFAF